VVYSLAVAAVAVVPAAVVAPALGTAAVDVAAAGIALAGPLPVLVPPVPARLGVAQQERQEPLLVAAFVVAMLAFLLSVR
jgi:hypothetical protein